MYVCNFFYVDNMLKENIKITHIHKIRRDCNIMYGNLHSFAIPYFIGEDTVRTATITK